MPYCSPALIIIGGNVREKKALKINWRAALAFAHDVCAAGVAWPCEEKGAFSAIPRGSNDQRRLRRDVRTSRGNRCETRHRSRTNIDRLNSVVLGPTNTTPTEESCARGQVSCHKSVGRMAVGFE